MCFVIFSLGPKNAVMDPVDPKQILAKLDLFTEYCEKKTIIPKDAILLNTSNNVRGSKHQEISK